MGRNVESLGLTRLVVQHGKEAPTPGGYGQVGTKPTPKKSQVFQQGPSAKTGQPGVNDGAISDWSEKQQAFTNCLFCKSNKQPYGSLSAGTKPEKLTNFGAAAVLGAVPTQTATGEIVLGEIAGSLEKLAKLGRWVVTAAGSVAGAVVLAMVPRQLQDGTLYTEEELKQLSLAETRVRFGFSQEGNIYGVHTSAESGMSRVQTIQAKQQGQTFVAELEPDFHLTWYPDGQGEIENASSYYPEYEDLDVSGILVRPIADHDQELLTTHFPEQGVEVRDAIIYFPEATGVQPLYIVYRKENDPRYQPGTVTGKGEKVEGIWLAKAGEELGAPVPDEIASKLHGKEFADFNRFREAFWQEVAAHPKLASQFIPLNRSRMEEGLAPIPRKKEQVGGRVSFELHHVEEIQNGGEVYDLDNLRVMTPRAHINTHREGGVNEG